MIFSYFLVGNTGLNSSRKFRVWFHCQISSIWSIIFHTDNNPWIYLRKFIASFFHFMASSFFRKSLICVTCGLNNTVPHRTQHAKQWSNWEANSVNILFHVRDRQLAAWIVWFSTLNFFCGDLLNLRLTRFKWRIGRQRWSIYSWATQRNIEKSMPKLD